MLNKSVCSSLKFHELPDDTCRLLATWIIAHLDHNGVFYADLVMVRSHAFPRRSDIDLAQIETALQAMQKAGLIVLFEARGERWQHWPGFAANQVGLRADRESSDYPQPPLSVADILPDDCRNDAGGVPPDGGEQVRRREEKRREVNRSEEEITPTPKPPNDSQQMFGSLCESCQLDWKVMSETAKRQVNQSGKKLREASYTPDDILACGRWWWDNDWRGKKGEPPTPAQLRDVMGKFKATQQRNEIPDGAVEVMPF